MTTSHSATTPYRFCTQQEIQERQELLQISELEATVETCRLPQAQRVLDKCLAIAKYRRSAAGMDDNRKIRSASTLIATLQHLMQIAATFRASPRHPRVDNVDTVVNFVVDRLRACQSDATRLMGSSGDNHDALSSSLPTVWHVQATRLLIWMQYLSLQSNSGKTTDSLLPRTIHTMRSTAYDAYWSQREVDAYNNNNTMDMGAYALDDEMLCYAAMYRISSISLMLLQSPSPLHSSLETSWSGILLEFTKRQQTTLSKSSSFSYPLWKRALQVAALASRQEFHTLLVSKNSFSSSLPILARCILSSIRFPWMYHTVQQYNVSFGKVEAVRDMDRLLGVAEKEDWTMDYAETFGVPVVVSDDDNDDPTITMIMKQSAMPNVDEDRIQQRNALPNAIRDDQGWVFREEFDSSEPWGISADKMSRLLQSGCFTASATSTTSRNDDNTGESKPSPELVSSLAAALSQVKPSLSAGAASKPAKKRPAKCKFFAKGSCRYGDKCRFAHT